MFKATVYEIFRLDPGEQSLTGDDVCHTRPSSQLCVHHEETPRWRAAGAGPPAAADRPSSRQAASRIARRMVSSTSQHLWGSPADHWCGCRDASWEMIGGPSWTKFLNFDGLASPVGWLRRCT